MTKNQNPKQALERLRYVVEQRFGQPLVTDRDYRSLSDLIFRATGEMLSPTTLKRLWGYLDENVSPRHHTLELLALYAGYRNWNALVAEDAPQPESGPSAHVVIDVANELAAGDTLLITWLPGRECRVKYLGNNRFRIEAARGTRLQEGIIFECPAMISGEPLYIKIMEGAEPGVYVCGKHQGVRIDRLVGQKDKNGL